MSERNICTVDLLDSISNKTNVLVEENGALNRLNLKNELNLINNNLLTIVDNNYTELDNKINNELDQTLLAGAVGEEANENLFTTLQNKKSFVGSIVHSNGAWYSALSARHRNGINDGDRYGMILYAPLTLEGDLYWSQQINGDWKDRKTLLDSSNYKNYAMPKNINTGIVINHKESGTYTLPSMDTRNKDYLIIIRAVNPAYFKFGILSPNSDRTTYWYSEVYSRTDSIGVSVSGTTLTITNNSSYQLEFRIQLIPIL